jgi:hypothetical protein
VRGRGKEPCLQERPSMWCLACPDGKRPQLTLAFPVHSSVALCLGSLLFIRGPECAGLQGKSFYMKS